MVIEKLPIQEIRMGSLDLDFETDRMQCVQGYQTDQISFILVMMCATSPYSWASWAVIQKFTSVSRSTFSRG